MPYVDEKKDKVYPFPDLEIVVAKLVKAGIFSLGSLGKAVSGKIGKDRL